MSLRADGGGVPAGACFVLGAVSQYVGAVALGQTPSRVELVGIAPVVAGIATRDRSGKSTVSADLEPVG